MTVSATTVDDDTAGFTIVESGGTTSVNESGTTDTFTAVLTAQPVSGGRGAPSSSRRGTGALWSEPGQIRDV